MIITVSSDKTIRQPVGAPLCGLRVDAYELNERDIANLLSLDNEKLRDELKRMLTRFPA